MMVSSNDGQEERADDSTRLARLRTDMAEDRSIMALERTFAGWLRTSFAAIGIGLGFRAVFGALEPLWLAKTVATLFILGGGWLAINAERRACRTMARFTSHKFEAVAAPNFRILAYGVVAGAIILTAGLWTLDGSSVARSG